MDCSLNLDQVQFYCLQHELHVSYMEDYWRNKHYVRNTIL